ncbi:hypothetical protein BT63DRAFT_421446 [Microthyrium microscopicum]|uniref:Caveolin n=1 Tax=Microthyrium microscopicum TaxID=703497 RepID=A0A6A6ULW2_9PEZI|nr:hypothetical protein BT63DRAFT_421446 [Microthyrium microscopicum]
MDHTKAKSSKSDPATAIMPSKTIHKIEETIGKVYEHENFIEMVFVWAVLVAMRCGYTFLIPLADLANWWKLIIQIFKFALFTVILTGLGILLFPTLFVTCYICTASIAKIMVGWVRILCPVDVTILEKKSRYGTRNCDCVCGRHKTLDVSTK